MGGAACTAGGVQGGARRLKRATAVGRGHAAGSVGQQPAEVQEETGPRRIQQWDDGGAGGAADGTQLLEPAWLATATRADLCPMLNVKLLTLVRRVVVPRAFNCRTHEQQS